MVKNEMYYNSFGNFHGGWDIVTEEQPHGGGAYGAPLVPEEQEEDDDDAATEQHEDEDDDDDDDAHEPAGGLGGACGPWAPAAAAFSKSRVTRGSPLPFDHFFFWRSHTC